MNSSRSVWISAEALDATIEMVVRAMKKANKVAVRRALDFICGKEEARTGRNPMTHQAIKFRLQGDDFSTGKGLKNSA